MNSRTKRALVAASVAGLLASAGAGAAAAEEQGHGSTAGGKVPCYGINKCKGTGECGGKGSSCHGSNECGGKGWIALEKDTCLKIQGGRLTAEEQAS
jgi:uncharacterized membrane protein